MIYRSPACAHGLGVLGKTGRGTLEQSFIGSLAERRTFAKTGSVNHTRGLAGYLATLHHGAVTFAWSVDDWMGSDPDLAALRARVLARLIGD